MVNRHTMNYWQLKTALCTFIFQLSRKEVSSTSTTARNDESREDGNVLNSPIHQSFGKMPHLNTAAIATTLKTGNRSKSLSNPKSRYQVPTDSSHHASKTSLESFKASNSNWSESRDGTPDFSERPLQMRMHIVEISKLNEPEAPRFKNDGSRFPQPYTLKLKNFSRYVCEYVCVYQACLVLTNNNTPSCSHIGSEIMLVQMKNGRSK